MSGASPVISNCTISGNEAASGGAIYCAESSPAILNCIIRTNGLFSAGNGGAIWISGAPARPIIMHCDVTGNGGVSSLGGGIYCDYSARPLLVNCLVAANTGFDGAGLACLLGAGAFVTNCTFADNIAGDLGGALYCWVDASATITNCVLWDDSALFEGDEIAILSGSTVTVDWSDVEGGEDGVYNIGSTVTWGANNIDPPEDPQFRQAVGFPDPPWDTPYYLSQELAGNDPLHSPCVDRGDSAAETRGLDIYSTRTDFVGDVGQVDLGWHYPRDCQPQNQPGHGIPDPLEIAGCSAGNPYCADCNYNGVPDWCDINYGTSQDANRNWVPDECEGQVTLKPVFTTDADFDRGTLINVNHNQTHNELQRNELATPLPYLWVPASTRGTVVRLWTTGENVDPADRLLGEYRSAPDNLGAFPSRTSVDLDGNVWVANRDEDYGGNGSVVKIGFVIGGTRCDMYGQDDPNGQYLKPPFKYSTCVDRDGDGLIRTSAGPGDFFDWPGQFGYASTALDECICNYGHVQGTGVRHVSVNRDNNLWVASLATNRFDLLDGDTGQPVQPSQSFNLGYGGYGGVIDCQNVLWSSDREPAWLLWYRTAPEPWGEPKFAPDSYGVGIDGDGYVWNTQLRTGTIIRFNRDGTRAPGFQAPDGKAYATANGDRGVGVTLGQPNEVWVANSGEYNARTVSCLDTGANPRPGNPVDLGDDGIGPTAIAVDQDGRVWVTCLHSSTVKCVDPVAKSVLYTIDLNWPGCELAKPYAFSDMTGQVTLHTSATGTWNVVHDSGKFGAQWHLVLWNRENCPNSLPEDTVLLVAVRAADVQTGLTSQRYVNVEHGVWFDAGVQGRFLEVRVRFRGSCPGGDEFKTPVLCDLMAHNALADCNCDGDVNGFDTDAFILALTNLPMYQQQYPYCNWKTADTNCDGQLNTFDIDPFVLCLQSEGCGCVAPPP